MTPRTLALLVWLTLVFVVTSRGAAQDLEPEIEVDTGEPAFSAFVPEDDFLRRHHERGGISYGMELKRMARQNGTPFEHLELSDIARPEFGAEIAMRGRNVLVIRDSDGSIRNNGFSGRRAQQTWQEILRLVASTYGDNFDLAMGMTEWQENFGAYYLPLANDIRGIGYQHLSGAQIFDQTGTQLQGLIAMNSYRTYLGRQGEVYGRIVFLQEIGHRWGAFVWYGNGPGNGRDMLGRDESHWSYFMDSGNSALEGNSWRANSNGSFSTETNAFEVSFSELDAYLIGVVPKNEVDPWFIIRDVNVRGQRDDFGQTLNAASPPAYSGRVTVDGTRHNVTIDDVVTAENDRSPGSVQAQDQWRIATVLVIGNDSSFNESDLTTVERMLDYWESLFETGTRGLGDLVFTLEENQQGFAGFGEACETTGDCDPRVATACLNTDGGRICSKRCAAESECGGGFCCAFDFCYPTGDGQCDAANNGGTNNGGTNNGGTNNGGTNNGGTNNGGTNNGANNGIFNNGDSECAGFVEDCERDGFVDSSGSKTEACSASPSTSGTSGVATLGNLARHLLRR
jgi:hypothetical protein